MRKPVQLELRRSFCTVLYCPYFWTIIRKLPFPRYKLHITTSIGRSWVSRRFSASAMFVTSDIPNLEAFFGKSIYSFPSRISFSCNNLICAIEQSWVMKTIWKMWEEKMYI